MRLCSNPAANPAFERVLQLAQGQPVSQPTNEVIDWESAVHDRIQFQRRLTPLEILHLGEGYLAGSTVEELASLYNIHRSTVMAQLERSGIARRGKGPNESQVARAVHLYQEGASTAAIGKVLGFSADTIRHRLIDAGVSIRGPHDWQRTTP